jgi:hypothetical protein
MVAPFLDPDLEWDFRPQRVASINTSGHKYGLVYPGVGWVVWRDSAALPEDLIFWVNYLGDNMPTFALNFSRPGAQVVAQYYNFLRLGFEGYARVQGYAREVATRLSGEIEEVGPFELITRGDELPVFAFSVLPAMAAVRSFYKFLAKEGVLENAAARSIRTPRIRRPLPRPLSVGASNWAATANWVARTIPTCVLIDIGTTSADLIPVIDGRVAAVEAPGLTVADMDRLEVNGDTWNAYHGPDRRRRRGGQDSAPVDVEPTRSGSRRSSGAWCVPRPRREWPRLRRDRPGAAPAVPTAGTWRGSGARWIRPIDAGPRDPRAPRRG